MESVASRIFEKFDPESTKLVDISTLDISTLSNYDFFIVGGSTVGSETWEDVKASNKWIGFFNAIDEVGLKGKKAAFFGLGDQVLWPLNFVDNMILLKQEFEKRGVTTVGPWPTEGYNFEESHSIVDGKFVGLVLDEDQQHELTEKRIDKWTSQIKHEFGI